MPLYQFRRISTGEEFEELLSISAKETFLQDPDIEQVIFAPAIVSGVEGISYKTTDGFKEVLSKVAEHHPTSSLADKTLKRGVKEVKSRTAAAKHRL